MRKIIFYVLSGLLTILAAYEFFISQPKLGLFFLIVAILIFRLNAWVMRLLQYFLAFTAVIVVGGILNPFSIADIQHKFNVSLFVGILAALGIVILVEGLIFLMIWLIKISKDIFHKRYL